MLFIGYVARSLGTWNDTTFLVPGMLLLFWERWNNIVPALSKLFSTYLTTLLNNIPRLHLPGNLVAVICSGSISLLTLKALIVFFSFLENFPRQFHDRGSWYLWFDVSVNNLMYGSFRSGKIADSGYVVET
jgi:hypothetical protein